MNNATKRLLLVIPSLTAGGAERVMSILAGTFAARGWETSLALLAGEGVPRHFDIPDAVAVHTLGPPAREGSALSRLRWNTARVRRLSRCIREKEPDAVISFMEQNNVIALLAARGMDVPVIISERIHPHHHRPHLLWRLTRPLVYPRCCALVVQTDEIARVCEGLVEKEKIHIIPNPVLPPPARSSLDGTRIIAAGRLDRQKGFDLLLEAFAALAPDFPDWQLDIFGDGKERKSLEDLRGDLGLEARVSFPGLTKELPREFAAADLFALPSRYEGFPNVLAEAMAAGLPSVASRCSGAVDLLENGASGILVPPENPAALAGALRRYMDDGDMRREMGAAASMVTERFSLDAIAALWERLLDGCLETRGLSCQ